MIVWNASKLQPLGKQKEFVIRSHILLISQQQHFTVCKGFVNTIYTLYLRLSSSHSVLDGVVVIQHSTATQFTNISRFCCRRCGVEGVNGRPDRLNRTMDLSWAPWRWLVHKGSADQHTRGWIWRWFTKAVRTGTQGVKSLECSERAMKSSYFPGH